MRGKLGFALSVRIEETRADQLDVPWAEEWGLGAPELEELEKVLLEIDPELDVARLATGTAREIFVGRLETIALTPIERWLVEDPDSGDVLFTLWLHTAHLGVLLDAHTNEVVGRVTYCDFETEGTDEWTAHDLSRELRIARDRERPDQDSELYYVRFDLGGR